MKFNKFTIAAIGIVLMGLAIRLFMIDQPLLEYFPERQTQTAEITRNIYVNGWADFWTPKVRYFTNGNPIPYVLEFPLYNGVVVTLYHLFGPNVVWGRIASLTFFVGSSVIFFKFLESTSSAKPRLITDNQQLIINCALLFFTFSPLHILISRTFQPDEMGLFLLLLAVYKKSWLIFSLAVLAKLPLATFAPVMLYASSRTNHRPTWNGIIKLCLSFLPATVWYWRASRLTIHPAISVNFTIGNWFQPQLWFNPKWYFSLFQIEHVWSLTTLGLLFFWLGLWSMIIKRPNIWLVWFLSGLIYLAIFNYHAMTHEYYHLLLLPPLSVFAGVGLESTLSNFTKHRNKLAVSIGVYLLIVASLAYPAIKKIISAPTSPFESEEMTTERYQLIEDFSK